MGPAHVHNVESMNMGRKSCDVRPIAGLNEKKMIQLSYRRYRLLSRILPVACLLSGLLITHPANADKLPVKELIRPKLMGEPEIPEGNIPDRFQNALYSNSMTAVKPIELREQTKPRTSWDIQSILTRILWTMFSYPHW